MQRFFDFGVSCKFLTPTYSLVFVLFRSPFFIGVCFPMLHSFLFSFSFSPNNTKITMTGIILVLPGRHFWFCSARDPSDLQPSPCQGLPLRLLVVTKPETSSYERRGINLPRMAYHSATCFFFLSPGETVDRY